MKGPSQEPASDGEGMGLQQKEQGQNWGIGGGVKWPGKGRRWQPAPPPGLPWQAVLLSSFYWCEVRRCVAELSHDPACVAPESTLIPSCGLGGFSPQHRGDRPGVLVWWMTEWMLGWCSVDQELLGQGTEPFSHMYPQLASYRRCSITVVEWRLGLHQWMDDLGSLPKQVSGFSYWWQRGLAWLFSPRNLQRWLTDDCEAPVSLVGELMGPQVKCLGLGAEGLGSRGPLLQWEQKGRSAAASLTMGRKHRAGMGSSSPLAVALGESTPGNMGPSPVTHLWPTFLHFRMPVSMYAGWLAGPRRGERHRTEPRSS